MRPKSQLVAPEDPSPASFSLVDKPHPPIWRTTRLSVSETKAQWGLGKRCTHQHGCVCFLPQYQAGRSAPSTCCLERLCAVPGQHVPLVPPNQVAGLTVKLSLLWMFTCFLCVLHLRSTFALQIVLSCSCCQGKKLARWVFASHADVTRLALTLRRLPARCVEHVKLRSCTKHTLQLAELVCCVCCVSYLPLALFLFRERLVDNPERASRGGWAFDPGQGFAGLPRNPLLL